jgi:3-phosphoshikimate 1-carboxyvinyltransferase
MTISAMEKFGVTAKWQNENTIFIKGNQSYSPKDKEIYIEGDYSNAAFFEALNLFGGNVKIENLSKDSLQGDKVYRHFFWQLKEGTPTINISDCPDLGPILFAVAAAKNGGVFLGTSRLKIKESDRGKAMAQELEKFGIDTKIFHDEIIINSSNLTGGNFQKPTKALCSHNDHRIVMAEAVLLTLTGGIIEGAEAVNKSFPDFFEKLETLGIEVKKI